MNRSKMKKDYESLFSLEVVVEKLYIPHEVCRFPSVAFRLLDFPTILIEHVEQDLATKIRRKVSSDPYYELPTQITELTDKHGNFVIKKGKSCLLKLPFATLHTHLSNTPMYVMIIDSYPQVPKLMGNTTVALDQEIRDIGEDIRKLGDTVPSVHGDKGLFKVFNLMGKEIGYIILGYRLMCLGSGLIPHIPENAIARRQSESYEEKSSKIDESMEKQHHHVVSSVKKANQLHQLNDDSRGKKKLSSSQDMGSMTDPEKHEILTQTIDMCDKEIHVALSDVQAEKPKELNSASTQTQRKSNRKGHKTVSIELLPPNSDSEDDFIINNIVNPPPLVYNSENEPKVNIHRPYLYYQDDASSVYTDDITIEDDLEYELSKKNVPKRHYRPEQAPKPKVELEQNISTSTMKVGNTPNHQQNIQAEITSHPQFQNLMNGFPGSFSNGPLFPVLTALLNELTKIQDPRFVQTAINQVHVAQQEKQQVEVVPKSKPKSTQNVEVIFEKLPTEESKEQTKVDQKETLVRGRKSYKTSVSGQDGVPKTKGWIRKTPNVGVGKSKLAYGLTNTQRLRLAKVNPEWLKAVEKEEKEAKSLKVTNKTTKKDDEEFDTGHLSDTLTEVRRLAEKNLNENDTLELKDLTMNSTINTTINKNRRRISPPRKKKGSSPSPARKRSKSPKHKYLSKVEMSSKTESREDEMTTMEQTELQNDQVVMEEEDNKSIKSLEVRIPSAQMYEEDSDFTESPKSYKYPGYVDSDEGKSEGNRFPGFVDQNVSMPESINGKANVSLNSTRDQEDDQPLESTRYSKPEHIDSHQFQSTDEPELQKLIDSGERSEVSDILSTDRSMNSPMQPSDFFIPSARFQVLNPKSSMQSPLPAIRKSHAKLDGSVAKESPVITPRTPPRSPKSSQHPTPTPRKKVQRRRIDFKPDSIHTESVSSYVPSDDDDILASEQYSDDFNENDSSRLSPDVASKWIPSTKLGYTIN